MTSPIEKVPNEVLEQILSFLPVYAPEQGYTLAAIEFVKTGQPTSLTRTMVLLQVSRQFRAVVQRLKFWYHFGFKFEDLVPWPRQVRHSLDWKRGHEIKSIRTARLFEALFADPHFASCLRYKSAWTFEYGTTWEAALRSIPSFPQTIRQLRLYLDFGTVSLSELRSHSQLADVTVISHIELDLTELRHLPPIRRLALEFPPNCNGSLAWMRGLQELKLRQSDSYDDEGYSISYSDVRDNQLLPVMSADTLTRLHISNCHDTPESLNAFPNLQHLHLDSSMHGSANNSFLKSFSGQLVSLDTQIEVFYPDFMPLPSSSPRDDPNGDWGYLLDFHDIDETWPLLSCSCIRQLKKLRLVLEAEAWIQSEADWTDWSDVPSTVPSLELVYIASSMEIVKRLSERIPLLEELEFRGGLDLEKSHYLGGFKNLRSLKWIYPSGFLGGAESERDVNVWILNEFRSSPNKPIVDVLEVGHWFQSPDYPEYR
jgi:hypothetical protein